ncbi:putative exosome complex exonuclease 2 [groundwater metagenome]|uniref:Putative exosome complex exonuclease 2 n=1 Tax=groundwater metagenome TaxID=717931 RepID=A0A098EAQ4_9ZZZZ
MDVEAQLKKDYVLNVIKNNKRIDERKFDEYRKISIKRGFVEGKAEGSAYVKIGDTEVLAGVKIDVGNPYPDTPDEGVITVGAEFRPIASPSFGSGPPTPAAIELARVVDRGIRESKCITTTQLIVPNTESVDSNGKITKKIWMVIIDIHIINDAGNLIDASGIAAMAALLDTKLPKYEDGKIIRNEFIGGLPITKVAIPVTFRKIDDKILLDLDSDEETAMDTRLTVTTTDMINAMQKGGTGKWTIEEIKQCVDTAFIKAEEIRKIVEA